MPSVAAHGPRQQLRMPAAASVRLSYGALRRPGVWLPSLPELNHSARC